MANEAALKISELFYSIQGESSHAGYPCFFIRVAGCNLRCTYCDTRYAYEGEFKTYTCSRILAELEKYPGVLVEITGGEPLLQKGVYPLFEQLLAAGRRVLLETNGSLSLKNVPAGVIKIMDMKCPGSSMHEKMNFDNFNFLGPRDEIKFVICSRADYDWAKKLVSSYGLHNLATVTFSPVTSILAGAKLAEWILADRLPVRLMLQLHTILWPGKTRGY
ncbi:MAG: radical SAM protein [Desulfobulbales bacterium]|nr:radical SAM protein [Desulfobulbales bacterium]